MAPMVSNIKNESDNIRFIKSELKNEREKLINLRKFIEKNFDYVGKDFSKRVREVYYDKKNKKAIYGTATAEEKAELADEGIDLLSIPWVEKDN